MPMAREHCSETIQKIFEWYFEMGETANPVDYRLGVKNRAAMTRQWNEFVEETPLVLAPCFLQPTPDWDCDQKSLAGTRDFFNSAIYSIGIN